MFTKEAFFVFVLIFSSFGAAAAQNTQNGADAKAVNNEKPAKQKKSGKVDRDNLTAEQIADATIIGTSGGGRSTLDQVLGLNLDQLSAVADLTRINFAQIRKTEIEVGKTTKFSAAGAPQDSTYQKRTIRGENFDKDRVRVDQKLTEAQYALIYGEGKTFGIINESVFVPREDADKNFQACIFHGLDALLRYKENGSKVVLVGKDKQMNVEVYKLDVTDKQNRTTRFLISTKLLRVLTIEYSMTMTGDEKPIKFSRKFYDYRNAQGTIIPYRSVLSVDGKQVEETNVQTVTFGMKIEEENFKAV